MKNKKLSQINFKIHANRKLFALCLIVGLALLGTGGYALVRHINTDEPGGPTPITKEGVDLSPPTATDKQDVEQHKDDLVQQQNQPPVTGKQTIAPMIVDANQYDASIEVRAFEPSVVESDGQCTVVFTHGTSKVTKQVPAIADATTTRCTNLQVPRSEFSSAGSWDVTVSYNSSKTEGSITSKIEVK